MIETYSFRPAEGLALDAGATIEANPFEKVPTPAKTRLCFREMSDQEARLMDLVMLSLLCGVSG